MPENDLSSLEAVVKGGAIGRVESDACKCIGVVVADRDGKILYANEKITSMFHYAPYELVGQPLKIFMSPKEAKRHDTWYSQWWNEGRVTREMAARQRIYAIDRNGHQVAMVASICATEWYEQPAALAAILPANWLGLTDAQQATEIITAEAKAAAKVVVETAAETAAALKSKVESKTINAETIEVTGDQVNVSEKKKGE
jgi:PAS domain S-box-containing protein